jgi:hypothetical protein
LVAALSWSLLEEPINRFRNAKTRTVLGPVPSQDPGVGVEQLSLNKDDGVYRLQRRLRPS